MLSESRRLILGIGDANPERIFTVTVTVTATQRHAAQAFLRNARQQLANGILAPQCSPTEEEEKTRALAFFASLAGGLAAATQVRGVAKRAGKRAAA